MMQHKKYVLVLVKQQQMYNQKINEQHVEVECEHFGVFFFFFLFCIEFIVDIKMNNYLICILDFIIY
jgi:hypothetical protein